LLSRAAFSRRRLGSFDAFSPGLTSRGAEFAPRRLPAPAPGAGMPRSSLDPHGEMAEAKWASFATNLPRTNL
jgi:hypothetical protein